MTKRRLSLTGTPLILIITALAMLVAACQQAGPPAEPPSDQSPAADSLAQPAATVILDGLLNPVGITALPDGSLLIAEEGTGSNDDSAGVTLWQADGQHGRLISGLPSSRDAGDLSGVPFAQWHDNTLYTSYFNAGSLLTLSLTLPAKLPNTAFSLADLTPHMLPANAVQLRNPFDLAFSADGLPVVSDATENGVAIMTDNGQTRFFHRFDMLENPGEGKRLIDAVPTGITAVGAEYYVTLTSGCPYPENGGQLVAIDMQRNQRTIADQLNMPIDVVRDQAGTIWLLEFARFDPEGDCFSGTGYQPHTGQLSRLGKDGRPETVMTQLNFPGSMTFDPDGNLLISEIFSGRIIKITGLDTLTEPLSLPALLDEPLPETAAQPETPAGPNVQFVNVASQVNLNFQHGAFVNGLSADPVAMMGAGLCWIDHNNDGWLDLYVVNSHALAESEYWAGNGGLPRNQLFQNEEGTFIDITSNSGADLALRGNGCIAADLNNDGWTDLFVTADGPNALLWNQGDGTFVEGAAAAGLDAPEWNSAAAAGDLNGDGLLDLFVAAYINLENKVEKPVGAFPQDFYGLLDRLYINLGNGQFREITADVELTREERGLGALLSDLDKDGDLDLYIANDGHPNRMYLNQPADNEIGFALEDISRSSNTNDAASGMGIAAGDYNNDGWFDLLVTNWDTELNALFLNQFAENQQLEFLYTTYRIGISGLGNNITGWGTVWADFDHDSDQDLLVVNGHVPIADLAEDAQLVRLYGNRLAEGQPNSFRDWTTQVGLGHDQLGPIMARGSAAADYDNDGDIDIAINTIGGRLHLLENQTTAANWLVVALPAAQPGTRAQITLPDGSIQARELYAGSSYLASEDNRFHFGLGQHTAVSQLTIIYPNGETKVYTDIGAGTIFYPY